MLALMRTSSESTLPTTLRMYLIDTNVVSEARKRTKANRGVISFFESVDASNEPLFFPLSQWVNCAVASNSFAAAAMLTKRDI